MKSVFVALLLVIAFARFSSAESPTETQLTTPAVGCESSRMSQADRLAAVNKVIAEANAEFDKNPDSIKDQEVRARIGTFAAGTMNDTTPFVSLDRWCWADFHEARKSLEAKDEVRAADYAQGWRVCLEASFPDRVDLAKPYFGCFPGKSKTKR